MHFGRIPGIDLEDIDVSVGDRIRGLTQRQSAVTAELGQAEDRWLHLPLELEEIGEA